MDSEPSKIDNTSTRPNKKQENEKIQVIVSQDRRSRVREGKNNNPWQYCVSRDSERGRSLSRSGARSRSEKPRREEPSPPRYGRETYNYQRRFHGDSYRRYKYRTYRSSWRARSSRSRSPPRKTRDYDDERTSYRSRYSGRYEDYRRRSRDYRRRSRDNRRRSTDDRRRSRDRSRERSRRSTRSTASDSDAHAAKTSQMKTKEECQSTN